MIKSDLIKARLSISSGKDTCDDDLLPFSIAFDRKGNPVVLDEEGTRIPPKEIDFPIKTQAIRSLETFTMVQYAGSSYYLLKIGGQYYLIEIP